MRHNPKSKPNAGRRLEWDAKKGKSVQKAGRPKANKAPASAALVDKTKDQLVKMGTPAAKAELKRRGRKADGTKAAWSAAPRKAARRGRARRNPEVSALGNPFIDQKLIDNGRFFIRLPYNIAPTAAMIAAMPPAAIYFVGRGEALDRKSNLVLATYDFRAGNFGDPSAMSDIVTVRSEDDAMEKLRGKSYPKGKKDMFSPPYNLFQVEHDGHALTLPALIDNNPFTLDLMRQAYPQVREAGNQHPMFAAAKPYPYPWTAASSPKNRALSREQIFENIYYTSGRDTSVPWRSTGPAGKDFRKRVIVTEYAGKKSMHPQEASYVEGNPEKQGNKAKVLNSFSDAEVKYALQGISDTLIAENAGLRPGMIEFCVFDEQRKGDIRVVVALWKLVTDEWAAWAKDACNAANADSFAGFYRGYPPSQLSGFMSYMSMPGTLGATAGDAGAASTTVTNPRRRRPALRLRHNPVEEFDMIEEDEEALANPARRNRRRR